MHTTTFFSGFMSTASRGLALQCSSLSVTSESAHLAAIALRLQHVYPPHNKLLVLKVADFDVKASLSNKSEQKLRSLNSRWLAASYCYTRPKFEAHYYSHVEPCFPSWTLWASLLSSTVKLLRSCHWCPTCNTPGLFWLCWDATNGPRLPVHVRCLICMILAFFADSAQTCSRTRIIADCYDPSPTACLTMHSKPCHNVLICIV